MPKATQEEIDEQIKIGKYRLGCQGCLRDDFDGVKELPKDWVDIEEVQSLEMSISVYEPAIEESPKGYYHSLWETHIGLCPDCQKEESDE